MPTPPLSEVEAAAQDFADALQRSTSGPEALWQIEGDPGSGKSTCLTRIAALLDSDSDLVPISVTPPTHHLDVGASALTDVAVGLALQGVVNGEVSAWKDNVGRWADRANSVRQWITNNSNRVVLLCDEPRSWGVNRSPDDFFGRRSFEVGFFLAALPCRRVITGDLPVPIAPQGRKHLSTTGGDLEWVHDYASWDSLEPAVGHAMEGKLVNHATTPLDLRLIIALVAVTSPEEVLTSLAKGYRTHQLVSGLAAALRDRGFVSAWEAWLRLSLTRRPFDLDLLARLIPSRATRLERDLIRHCLIYGNHQLRIHDQLKLYAARWRTEHGPQVRSLITRASRTLFEWHQIRFEEFAVQDSPRALSESLEAFHFASATGSSSLIDQARPVFVDQLDALGWSLSYEHRDYVRAAGAFEQAVTWDDQDDYAHHYLAYNLDRAGQRIEDVERHYRRAIDLNRTHSWWRSRLVIFLLARGRIAEARAEWEEALLALGVGDGDASIDTYDSLHCWVAGALLDAGEAQWASEVLEELPPWARAQLDSYTPLAQRADALLEVGDGPAVVPAWRLRPRWWESGPELLQHRLGAGEVLVRWVAGRVENKDEQGIRIRGAVLDVPHSGAPSIAWTQLTYDQFDELCRDAVRALDLRVGSFVEIGVYASEGTTGAPATTLVRVLPERSWNAAGPPLFRGDRYLTDLVHPR